MFYAGGMNPKQHLNLTGNCFGSGNCHYWRTCCFWGLFLFCFLFSLRLFCFYFFVLNNMDIHDRINVFNSQVRIALINEKNESEIENFVSYWTEYSLNGKKFRAEKEKVFDIKKRFNTWMRNQKKWFPEKKSKVQILFENYEKAKANLGL